MPTTRQTYPIEFRGGLITNMSPLQQGINSPGSARTLRNFEPSIEGGYKRILGYDKYDQDIIPPYGIPVIHGASQTGTSLNIANGAPFSLTPNTLNYLDGVDVEPSGYQFTISDSRVFGLFTGNGANDSAAAQALANQDTTPLITNGTAVSQTVIGLSCGGTATAVPTLFSTTSTLYATLTVIGLDSGARAQIPVFISNKSISTQRASVS